MTADESKKNFDYEKFFMGVGDIDRRKKRNVKVDCFEYRISNFFRHLKKIDGRMGDIGCGGGQFLEKIKHVYPNLDLSGCDISKKAIQLASILSKDINFKLIDDNGVLPFGDNFFDLCTSLNVLEHVKNIEENLKEIHRVLKKGGKFHLCVPCEGQPFTMTYLYKITGLGKDFTYKNWGHIQPELTHQKMLGYLNRAGFTVDKITYSLHFPVEFINLFLYFIPKEILNFILGQKSYQYTDAGVYQNQLENKTKKGPLYFLRYFWLILSQINEFIRFVDSLLLQKVSFTASTMHITCSKNNE